MDKMSNETRFVVDCMKSSLNGNTLENELFNDVDFEKVYRIASSHRIMGLVFASLKAHKEKLPKEIFDKMSAANKMMIMSSVARNQSVDEIKNLFDKNSIAFVLLKGAVLQDLYPEKYMRYSADTDVLVKDEDYEKTYPLLKSLSYKFDSQNDKHFVFQKKPYVCVEIHKKLISSNCFFDPAWENVDENEGQYFLKKEFELTYLVYHAAEDLTKTAGMGIHSVVDIYLYLKKYEKELDKKLLEKYLGEVGLLIFFESIKNLGEIWFDEKQSDEFYLTFTNYIFSGGRSGNAANAAAGQIDSDKPLLLGKLKFLLSKIFLPYKDLKKIYPALGKAPFLLPLFWGMRICGIIFRPEHHGFERAKIIIKKTDRKSVENAKNILRRLELENKEL